MNIPLIRIELEGIKHQLIKAIHEHQLKIDNDLISAVYAYCQPENIAQIVRTTANKVLDDVIREEVESFFRYGAGRTTIAEAVKTALSPRTQETEEQI